MRRRSARRPSADEEDLEEEPEDDEEPSGPPRARRGPHARPSVRPWNAADDPDPAEDEEGAPGGLFGFLHRPKRPVYFRARDSVYFEPLVALAILILLLVSLWAYTQNWPPVYVIESDSMQHGDTDNLGLINTGDLVLAQKAHADQIVPYVVGLQTGYMTYGEYGDVLLYYPDGLVGTPVIHRALVYIESSSDGTTYNIPSLAGLACGNATNSVYSVSSSPTGCGTTGVSGTLTLHGIGWRSVVVTIPLNFGRASGFVTMGDNNYVPGTSPESGLTDQSVGISALVQPAWVVGVARGMLPWFGSVKLLLAGTASQVPTESWEFLGLTMIGVVLLAMGIHYLFRAEGIEDPRRKLEEEDDEEADEEEEAKPPAGGSRWLHPLRGWRSQDEEDEPETSTPAKHGRPAGRRRDVPVWGGRPRPSVGRKSSPAKGHRRHDPSSDDEL